MAGAEDAAADLARVIHAHRGTTPAARAVPPAPPVADPQSAERAKLRTAQLKKLASIVWPANAQENAEVQRKAGMLLEFMLELIANEGMK